MKLETGIAHNNHFDHEIFTFTKLGHETNGEFMEMVITLGSGGSAGLDGLFHRHPQAKEIFTVTKGCIKVMKDGITHEIREGESITVLPNTPHYFRNAIPEESEVTVRFEPALQYDTFFANFAEWREQHPEWFGARGDMPIFLLSKMSAEYPNHMYANKIPIFLQKVIMSLIYHVGKLFVSKDYGAFRYERM